MSVMPDYLNIIKEVFSRDRYASPPVEALLIVEGGMLAKTRKTASYLLKVSAVLETGNLHVASMKGLVYQTGKPIQEIA